MGEEEVGHVSGGVGIVLLDRLCVTSAEAQTRRPHLDLIRSGWAPPASKQLQVR